MELSIAKELASTKNPLGLQVGQQVRVKAISKLEYDADGHKCLVSQACNRPAFVVNSVVRCTGHVIPGHYSSYDFGDDEPARFKVANRIRFYVCTYGIGCKEFLVHPGDICLSR